MSRAFVREADVDAIETLPERPVSHHPNFVTAAGLRQIDARLRELADQENGTGKHYLDRVKQLESWRRRLKTVLPVLGALLGPKNNQ